MLDQALSIALWHTLKAATAALLAGTLAACGGSAADALPVAQAPLEQALGSQARHDDAPSDAALRATMAAAGLTGRVSQNLTARLQRALDPRLAELGRLLFFDTAAALHDDNHCGGCHAPSAGFGDTQSIAIGIDSNGVVGANRSGPRNQRRTPSVVNTAFYPALMWNGRFFAPQGDPFSNAQGFSFPLPEGTTQFPPNDLAVTHLLIAQAHIPPTELTEVAGFTGTRGTIGARFDAFDDGHGSAVPAPDTSGFRNQPIRQAVLQRLNATPSYVGLFGESFPEVAAGRPIDFTMFARAIAEFEFTLVRANAPVDALARGDDAALSSGQKRGAAIFFGKGRCVACHAVGGSANEMFSDFRMHNIGVPQIAPAFGPGLGNVLFDGAGEDEDFGLEQVSGRREDRYKFRSSPLRNAALQPAFFHNGAFTRLEDAIAHHLDVRRSNARYDAAKAGVAADLRQRRGPVDPLLATLDPLLADPIALSAREFDDLSAFVRHGLLDPRARAGALCRLVPRAVPSGRPQLRFVDCER